MALSTDVHEMTEAKIPYEAESVMLAILESAPHVPNRQRTHRTQICTLLLPTRVDGLEVMCIPATLQQGYLVNLHS